WRPVERLSLDMGQFDTIYGAEVNENWRNLNYTRGALFIIQPFWHTGLRAAYQVTDAVSLNGLVINGTNTQLQEGNRPSLGLQLKLDVGVSIALGYLTSLEPSQDTSGAHNFFDLVITGEFGDLSLVANANYNRTDGALTADNQDATYLLGSLAVRYAFTEAFATAVRGEYVLDADNNIYGAVVDTTGLPEDEVSVITGTLTLEYKPIAGNNTILLRLDNRIDSASATIFLNEDSEPTDLWFTTVLGLVVNTSGD
ncbi:MAG: outer membrane beta-barrel protein, partial [Myxococcota bacterium]